MCNCKRSTKCTPKSVDTQVMNYLSWEHISEKFFCCAMEIMLYLSCVELVNKCNEIYLLFDYTLVPYYSMNRTQNFIHNTIYNEVIIFIFF